MCLMFVISTASNPIDVDLAKFVTLISQGSAKFLEKRQVCDSATDNSSIRSLSEFLLDFGVVKVPNQRKSSFFRVDSHPSFQGNH